ncbi:DNA (cytosine-5-)-methyltransferase [Pontibacter sp. JH31]|uniref:Cytosine-specific methyltransferase n=1 Tax=Pontibacter aquaedesilientis TaxID=2766980 RepID=A0ABR7XCC8_9BACT|nr:DNA (cytosine-5-)-methyltransferase [Pontibacter aquaedesilientis]MBD1395957.1 DNA (cytosine-5-)-methyltransferase [Pontibacter aquaedesilientis]
MNTLPKVVDLFCGIGGLTHGFVKEGFNVVAGIDFDGECRFAYEKNNNSKFLQRDLTVTHSSEVNELFGDSKLKVLIGCAPCQAFSTLNNKSTLNDKWKLLYSFGRFISEIKPDIISMENVPNLLKFDSGKVFNDFVKVLEISGYQVTYKVLNAKEYGVPQNRNRLILIASLHGKVEFLPPTHNDGNFVSLKKAIGHLPEISDGEVCAKDSLHRSRSLSPLNKKRIEATPYGGGWTNWPEELRLECHNRATGKTYGSFYGRMTWEDVAPTLTTQCIGLGNGRFGHPEQNRAISLREAAIIQSFPDNYELINPNKKISIGLLSRHIGNAVPVLLGSFIARTIKYHLSQL